MYWVLKARKLSNSYGIIIIFNIFPIRCLVLYFIHLLCTLEQLHIRECLQQTLSKGVVCNIRLLIFSSHINWTTLKQLHLGTTRKVGITKLLKLFHVYKGNRIFKAKANAWKWKPSKFEVHFVSRVNDIHTSTRFHCTLFTPPSVPDHQCIVCNSSCCCIKFSNNLLLYDLTNIWTAAVPGMIIQSDWLSEWAAIENPLPQKRRTRTCIANGIVLGMGNGRRRRRNVVVFGSLHYHTNFLIQQKGNFYTGLRLWCINKNKFNIMVHREQRHDDCTCLLAAIAVGRCKFGWIALWIDGNEKHKGIIKDPYNWG